MTYLLDTNILIHQARGSNIWNYIKDNYFPKGIKYNARISIVSVAESESFAIKNNWGINKIKLLTRNIRHLEPINLNDGIVEKYIQIDLYSQNKQKSLRLPKKYSARNMGKNDIWIAATAANYQFILLTTDKDFSHLDGVFLDVIYIDIQQILNK